MTDRLTAFFPYHAVETFVSLDIRCFAAISQHADRRPSPGKIVSVRVGQVQLGVIQGRGHFRQAFDQLALLLQVLWSNQVTVKFDVSVVNRAGARVRDDRVDDALAVERCKRRVLDGVPYIVDVLAPLIRRDWRWAIRVEPVRRQFGDGLRGELHWHPHVAREAAGSLWLVVVVDACEGTHSFRLRGCGVEVTGTASLAIS